MKYQVKYAMGYYPSTPLDEIFEEDIKTCIIEADSRYDAIDQVVDADTCIISCRKVIE